MNRENKKNLIRIITGIIPATKLLFAKFAEGQLFRRAQGVGTGIIVRIAYRVSTWILNPAI